MLAASSNIVLELAFLFYEKARSAHLAQSFCAAFLRQFVHPFAPSRSHMCRLCRRPEAEFAVFLCRNTHKMPIAFEPQYTA